MKKISGKALSLVLSLALVVSSFSASFASAATKSETGTASIDNDTVYLSNGGSGDTAQFDLTKYLGTAGTDYTLKTYDHQTVADAAIDQVSSSSSLLKVTQDTSTDHFWVAIKSASTTKGTFTLNVLLKGTVTRPDYDDPVNVTGRATVTVNVLAKDTFLIGAPAASITAGDHPDDVSAPVKTLVDDTSSNVKDQSVSAALYKVGVNDDNSYKDALATYDPQNVKDSSVAETGSYVMVSYPGTTLQYDATNSTATKVTYKVPMAKATSGSNLRLTAYEFKSGATNSAGTKEATANFSVANTVTGPITNIAKGDGDTHPLISASSPDATASGFTASKLSTSKTYAQVGSSYVDVTGANVVTTTTNAVVVESGRIASLKAETAASVEIQDGTTGDVTVSKDGGSDITLAISGGTVGEVTAYEGSDVTIDAGTVSSIADANEVTIFGAKVGNVTADTVTVAPADDESAATVGTISAKDVTVDSTQAKAVTGNITATADGTITLTGDNTSVGTINLDYYTTEVKLNGFVGTIAAPTKAANATISSANGDLDTNAVVSGALSLGTLALDDGTVRFDNSLKVATLGGGTGTLVINAGALNVTDEVSTSNTLKLADAATVVSGTKLYTATTGIADIDSLTGFGFTQKVTTGTTTDTFYIDKVNFAGLTISGGSSTLAPNDSTTFTAQPFPASQTLPEGYTVAWEFTGDDTYFDVTTNGNSATVKAINFDDTFASLNKGTLRAYVVDQYGVEDDTYGDASISITIAKQTYKSDTTGDVKMNVGGTYQFKITSLDGKVPGFGLGGNGAAVTSTKVSGKDYFYKVTANKAGDYGVYVNGTRVAILRITAASAKIDTTVVTIKVGNTYQFKVTSAAKPAFGLGSSALQTVATSSKGQDYFYKVKAVSGKTGDKVGVYVNGSRAAIATIG